MFYRLCQHKQYRAYAYRELSLAGVHPVMQLDISYQSLKQVCAGRTVYYMPLGTEALLCFVLANELLFGCSVASAADLADFEAVLKTDSVAVVSREEAILLASVAANTLEMAPRTSDGKPVFLPNLFPGPVTLCHSGAGDITGGRGNGPLFNASSNSVGDTAVEWQFNDWIYLAGGGIRYMGGGLGDYVDMLVYAPATTVTPNINNTGNCNCIGPGNALIVPAASNGAWDMDPLQAIPVPSETGTGWYAWSEPDTGTGTVIPLSASTGAFNLYTVPVNLARFVSHLPLLGDGVIDLTIPAVKPKKLLPHWKSRVVLHNGGHAGLAVVWHVVTARIKTV